MANFSLNALLNIPTRAEKHDEKMLGKRTSAEKDLRSYLSRLASEDEAAAYATGVNRQLGDLRTGGVANPEQVAAIGRQSALLSGAGLGQKALGILPFARMLGQTGAEAELAGNAATGAEAGLREDTATIGRRLLPATTASKFRRDQAVNAAETARADLANQRGLLDMESLHQTYPAEMASQMAGWRASEDAARTGMLANELSRMNTQGSIDALRMLGDDLPSLYDSQLAAQRAGSNAATQQGLLQAEMARLALEDPSIMSLMFRAPTPQEALLQGGAGLYNNATPQPRFFRRPPAIPGGTPAPTRREDDTITFETGFE